MILNVIIVLVACTTSVVPTTTVTPVPAPSETATVPTVEPLVYFREADMISSPGSISPDAFKAEVDGARFLVTWSDEKALLQDGIQNHFRLELEENFFITRLWIASFEDDWILICSVSNNDVSGGFVARFNGQSLHPIWIVKSYDPRGEPIIRGETVYVTGDNSVSKLNLKTGEYVWKRGIPPENNTREFFAFERPTFEAGQVILKGANHIRTLFEQVRVDDTNGAIINIATTTNP